MARQPLFDSLRPGPAREHWTVSELTVRIKLLLEESFGPITLVGEISGLSRPSSGHIYLNLKDKGACIRAVIWRSAAERLRFDLTNGLAVRVVGDLSVYEPRGDYSLHIRKVEPEGVGALELAFRQLSERLDAEGLFAPERKRPLPAYPRRIVVVTSPSGAAVRDFLQIVGRRWPATEILIAPSRVQGEGAERELAAGLETANRLSQVDLIVLTRGGGSLEDLWPFNTEILARAIVGSRVPVVSAVGHETDFTIADRAADFRAATPSEAAERCVPDAAKLTRGVIDYDDRLQTAGQRHLVDARRQLSHLAHRLEQSGRRRSSEGQSRIALLENRLKHAGPARLEALRQALLQRITRLDALSPLAVLARGYSITMTESGQVLRDATRLHPGDRIHSRLERGLVWSRVEAIEPSGDGLAEPQ